MTEGEVKLYQLVGEMKGTMTQIVGKLSSITDDSAKTSQQIADLREDVAGLKGSMESLREEQRDAAQQRQRLEEGMNRLRDNRVRDAQWGARMLVGLLTAGGAIWGLFAGFGDTVARFLRGES